MRRRRGRPSGDDGRSDAVGAVGGIYLGSRVIREPDNRQQARELDKLLEVLNDWRRRVPTLDVGLPIDESPYPGLRPFTSEQFKWFFGRDKLTAELAVRLERRMRTGGVQVVVGPSGAGKTSLLGAGLLPLLARGALADSNQWLRLMLTPTADPLQALAAQIAAAMGAEPAVVAKKLTDPRSGPAELLRSMPGEHARVVLVVDQFEELFTLCADDRQRITFIDLLTQIAAMRPDFDAGATPVGLVVLGLRADFCDTAWRYLPLQAALQDAPLIVGPMSESELGEAIVGPARQEELDVEPSLVELLLSDLRAMPHTGADETGGYEAGRLPLLAHALLETWRYRRGRSLTVEAYQASGGIGTTFAALAEGVFVGLDLAEQRLARSLFLRLVKIGNGGEDIRRRLPRAELMSDISDASGAGGLLDVLTRARVLGQQWDTVEITHGVLLRSWPRLRDWIDEERTEGLVHEAEVSVGWVDRLARLWRRTASRRSVAEPRAELANPPAARINAGLERLFARLGPPNELLRTSLDTTHDDGTKGTAHE